MDDTGSLAGFLTGKMVVALAVLLLIGSIFAMKEGLDRNTRRAELNSVAESVVADLREIQSMPGRVEMKRELPSLKRPYRLVISGRTKNGQVIEILVSSEENLNRTLVMGLTVNNGDFRIESYTPCYLMISKDENIWLELV